MGIESTFAHTLTEGMAAYEPDEHDLVILDINLPDGNGLDFIPVLKKKKSDIKIVVVSAYDTKDEHKKAYKQGAYHFIGKPFDSKTISKLVDQLVPEH